MSSSRIKQTSRGPLADLTNVLSKNSNQMENRVEKTTKELVVKIPRVPDNKSYSVKKTARQCIRARSRSILLDDTIWNLDESNVKKGQKELFIKMIPLVGITLSRGSKLDDRDHIVDNVRCPLVVNSENNENSVAKNGHNKPEYNVNGANIFGLENKAMETNTRCTMSETKQSQKELLVKITHISRVDKVHKEIEKNVSESNASCRIGQKELFIKVIPTLVGGNSQTKDSSDAVGRCTTGTTHSQKELLSKVTQISRVDDIDKKIKEHLKNNPKYNNITKKPVKNVKFTLKTTQLKESHNLRKLEPKNYMEESIMDSTTKETIQTDLKKTNHVPIYRKIILDEPKNNNQTDLYEFVDVSPKTKRIARGGRPHRSSILFDKNTHEILQKIEEKEAKAKRKIIRKKRVYNKKVDAIMLNVKKRICSKNIEKSDKLNVGVQNTLNNIVQGQKNVQSSNSPSKVIQINNFTDEVSLPKPYKMPISQEKSILQQQTGVNNIENITLRRGGSVTFDKLKGSVNVIQTIPSQKSLDSISVCSESDRTESQDMFDGCLQRQKNVPLCNSHTKMIQVNNFSDESSIIVHHSSEEPLSNEKSVPEKLSSAIRVVNRDGVTLLNTFDKLKLSGNVIKSIPPQKSLNNNRESSYSNSIESDVDSFGFDCDDEDDLSPIVNTNVSKKVVNILDDVVIRHKAQHIESPNDFNHRRPNANSTMIHMGARDGSSSPWRLNWVNIRHNPHFINVKSNALPSLDQEPVLDHTLVEEFEVVRSQTTLKKGKEMPAKKGKEIPAKKAAVQQSILDFVGSNIENENEPLQCSLFDYEAFNSPLKKTRTGKEYQNVEVVKRNRGIQANIVASTPVKRRVLGDISNSSSGEQTLANSYSQDVTFFGFDENSLRSIHETRKNNGPARLNDAENENIKPSRFDSSVLKSYTAKGRKKKKVNFVEEPEAVQLPNESISLVEALSDEDTVENIRLFEEPEERWDNMSPVHITEKKYRRKRLDSSNSDTEEQRKKRKKHKRTKLEMEQEKWIEEFNQMCAEVDQHELERE